MLSCLVYFIFKIVLKNEKNPQNLGWSDRRCVVLSDHAVLCFIKE